MSTKNERIKATSETNTSTLTLEYLNQVTYVNASRSKKQEASPL
ncbi:MAG: hypothetical protein ACXADH_10110 [Candidatus Kariarchaeaceae archaeon]